MWIKICANTNLEDALLAAELGADAIGFVFAPSQRKVTPSQAAEIISRLPACVEKVGVFPEWTAERIIQATELARLTAIQLHGAPDLALIHALHAHFAGENPLIQAVHWNIGTDLNSPQEVAAQVDWLAAMPEVDRILIDSKVGRAAGGTGVSFPWHDARSIFFAHPKVILAGGLNPNNVGAPIRQLKPWGVDVASGVEASPGKKDRAKLLAFIEAARSVRC